MDTLGYRCKFGVMTPSTNTVVQPEYDDMRFPGVTNHISRMHIPDEPVNNDNDFNELIRRIDIALEESLDRVMTCRPDWLILGISAESIWGGGLEPARRIAERIRARAGDIGVTQAADALPAALKALGVRKSIALLTPYHPVAEGHLKEFIEAIGYSLVRSRHLECKGPVEIAFVPEKELFDAATALDGDDVDAIVQFGANLPMGRVAAQLEPRLGKPVIAINTATYWHALRSMGIGDRKGGCGRLLEEH
ncbi:maleate cis-trans isomerase family protein [Futiania mangrovi]|uniref:Asp/Glu racemase n=1 Tax=Futiania mangrovi TaxID=2959716 RepID=A0A9J6PBE5_9PROT|nr:IgiC [Futiania mangrovii]MCP1335486.1 Asp/Glu racemase [Futiania mangrovii]